MEALIDGDLILYRACHALETRMYVAYNKGGKPVACSSRKKDLEEYDTLVYKTAIDEEGYKDGTNIIDAMTAKLTRTTMCRDYIVFLTGSNNFRVDIYPEYKAHRPPKPILHAALKEYMLDTGAVLIEGQEADDALGIHQTKNTIICSYDKDLRMIPGNHYDFNKKKFFNITEEEGMYNFYIQLLTGDSTDNIPGLKGVGPKTAEKMLHENKKVSQEMYQVVKEAYEERGMDEDVILRNARLLWIRQEEGELWLPPK